MTAEPVSVGLRKQLLVDDWVVAEKSGVTRELGRVEKQNGGKPVFEGYFYGTVLHDEGKFKLWYRGNPYGYAESADGLHFDKISLLKGLDPAHHNTASFYIDPNETDPAHRYKICYAYLRPHAAVLGYSADGIHWNAYNDGKPVTHRAADTYNQIVWDAEAKVYRMFTRTDFARPADGLEVRGTRDMVNPDIKDQRAALTTPIGRRVRHSSQTIRVEHNLCSPMVPFISCKRRSTT